MEQILGIIDRALRGEAGARQYIEGTSSVYVLDLTNPSQPTTFGCWEFIHRALNEIERHETANPPFTATSNDAMTPSSAPRLVDHARLVAKVALRVARRSLESDKALVSTAIANAASLNAAQSNKLVEANLRLRDIVMGRIAAMAFDYTFHRRSNARSQSACADRIVMDTFAAILSANSIVSGPAAVQKFATEWIIPSSNTLPSFAVAAVVCHLGVEGARQSVPYGTKDMLQQLSAQVMSVVLVPMLSDAISEDCDETQDRALQHEENANLATMCLRAIKAWCDVTELSLPQLKHICSKSEVNIVTVLNDALYSDSRNVVDAVADLLEATIPTSDERVMSSGRMNLVKYILGVDDETFNTKFSPHQLKLIESSEIFSIVGELASAVGIQRFRFVERQTAGDYHVCLNLTRVAACVCAEWCSNIARDVDCIPDVCSVEFLMRAAAHPSLTICALALSTLTKILALVPALSTELLRIIQRRAIWPSFVEDGKLVLEASNEDSDESQCDFNMFRETVICDALIACWKAQQSNYLTSCASAVEEFCTKEISEKLVLPLEAALYCLEVIAPDFLTQYDSWENDNHMNRLLCILKSQPPILMTNSIGRERLCSFVCKYTGWFAKNGKIGEAATLVTSAFFASARHEQCSGFCYDASRNVISPRIQHASKALHALMAQAPSCFATPTGITSLHELWDASHEGLDLAGVVSFEDRLTLLRGICFVIRTLPHGDGTIAFEDIFSISLKSLEKSSLSARQTSLPLDAAVLQRISEEIQILSALVVGLAGEKTNDTDRMESGCDTSSGQVTRIGQHLMAYMRKGWPYVSYYARNFGESEIMSEALSVFACDLLPFTRHDAFGIQLLQEVCELMSCLIQHSGASANYCHVYGFVEKLVSVHGTSVENSLSSASIAMSSMATPPTKQVADTLENVILGIITSTQSTLGDAWTQQSEQKNGQAAFESRISLPKPAAKSNESLGGLLSMLTVATEICPLFLCTLPSLQGKDPEVDSLVQRAFDSSVAALSDPSPLTLRNAITFLSSMVKRSSFPHQKVQEIVIESFAKIGIPIMEKLLFGICGNYPRELALYVAELVRLLLMTGSDPEAMLGTSLQPDHFLLGVFAKRAVLSFCLRAAISPEIVTTNDLAQCFEDVWLLHQSEDTDALPTSDAVAQLLQTYSILS